MPEQSDSHGQAPASSSAGDDEAGADRTRSRPAATGPADQRGPGRDGRRVTSAAAGAPDGAWASPAGRDAARVDADRDHSIRRAAMQAVLAAGTLSADHLLILEGDGERLIPTWQFSAAGRVWPVVADINVRLDAVNDPWGVASWWVSPHPRLGGRAPRDLIGTAEQDDLRRLISGRARLTTGFSPAPAVAWAIWEPGELRGYVPSQREAVLAVRLLESQDSDHGIYRPGQYRIVPVVPRGLDQFRGRSPAHEDQA